MTGWNLPPGVTQAAIDAQFGPAEGECPSCGEWLNTQGACESYCLDCGDDIDDHTSECLAFRKSPCCGWQPPEEPDPDRDRE